MIPILLSLVGMYASAGEAPEPTGPTADTTTITADDTTNTADSF